MRAVLGDARPSVLSDREIAWRTGIRRRLSGTGVDGSKPSKPP